MYTHTICVLIFFALCNLSAINCNLCAGRSRRLVSFFVLSSRVKFRKQSEGTDNAGEGKKLTENATRLTENAT